MKKIQFILILLLTYTIVVSQNIEPKLWESFTGNPNNIKSGDFISFPNKGPISDGKNQEIFKEVDLIQLIAANDSVLIVQNNKVEKREIINDKFNVQFNKVTKNFAFETNDQNTLTKKSVDDKEYWEQLSIYNKAQMLYEYYGAEDSCNYNKLLRAVGVGKENNIIQQLNAGQSCDQVSTSSAKGSQEASENLKNIFSSIGGLDVTKYADGLAKFLVKRTKEELTISFFENFKDELNQLDDLKELFPKTNTSLQRIVEIYDYNRYLTLMRESYHEDFQHLPKRINDLISSDGAISKEIKFGVEISSKIIGGIQSKEHPGSILSSIDISKTKEIDSSIIRSVKFSQSLSEALRENGSEIGNQYWVDKSKMLELTQNQKLFKIFFGLLIEDERIKNDPELYATLNNITNFDKYAPLIVKLSDVTQGISSLIKNQKSEDNLSAETVSKYIAYSLELIKISNEGYFILSDSEGNNNFNTIISMLEKSNSVFSDIYTKKYSTAIFSVIDLIESIPELKVRIDLEKLMNYGTFMAASIEAENSDEVAKIIETYALPSGSSRVKRNSWCNIALNGYLGLYGGCEGVGDEDKKFVSGITAPIGISMSHGGKGGSISLFLSAIDIGAISAFRFTNNSSQIAKVYLKEIFSPGVFLSYGIPKTPISINGGFQSAPLLSRVSTSQNEVNITYQPRWSVSVLVDIPLLNIYNRTTKPKCKEE